MKWFFSINLRMGNYTLDSNYTNNPFFKKVKLWSDNASENEFADWEVQIKMLSEIGDLITPDLSLEEVIAAIYSSVNQLHYSGTKQFHHLQLHG